MYKKREIILKELHNVSKKLGKDRFTREDFFKNTSIPITRNDIEKEFGSFAKAMIASGLRPVRWKTITDEQLFETYDNIVKKLGHYPLGASGVVEISNNNEFKISGHTFKRRFGGLKNLLFEYKNWLLEKDVKTKYQHISAYTKAIKEEAGVYFDNKQRYSGKAAENLVVAELLFKGFNAQILQVDEGIDGFATNIKKNELYLIQVKHTYYSSSTKSRPISLTVSSFEKNKKSNVYYIFVLEREINRRDFLILPFHKVDEMIENESIIKNNKSTKMNITIVHKGEDIATIGKTDVSRYLNAWDLLL